MTNDKQLKKEIKHIASEIVRGMTNGKLTKQQAEMLRYVAQTVMETQLIYKKKLSAQAQAGLTEYEIWSEGYCANETEGKWTRDVYLGTAWGKSFEDACVSLMKSNKHYSKHFDKERMTYWGCRLYGKEKGAQTNW